MSSCVKIDEIEYIKDDKRYICYDEEHMKYMYILLLPALFLWLILVPFLLFFDLFRNRKNFNNLKIRFMYGFLF